LKIKRVDLAKIKKLRKEANISLEKMSELLGYESPNGYYYLEIGRVNFPADKLAMVSEILNVPIDQLFFDVNFAKMAKR
jgi:transcriptional regulator with XRE-family HTH domain